MYRYVIMAHSFITLFLALGIFTLTFLPLMKKSDTQRVISSSETPTEEVTITNVNQLSVEEFWNLQKTLRAKGKLEEANNLLQAYDPSQLNQYDRIHYYKMMTSLDLEAIHRELQYRPMDFVGLSSEEKQQLMDFIIATLNAIPPGHPVEKNYRAIFDPVIGSDWRIDFAAIHAEEEMKRRQRESDAAMDEMVSTTTGNDSPTNYLGFENTCFYAPVDEVFLKAYCQGVFDVFTKKFRAAIVDPEADKFHEIDDYENCHLRFDFQLANKKITKHEKLKNGDDSREDRSNLTISWEEKNNNNEKTFRVAQVSLAEALDLSIQYCQVEALEESRAADWMKVFTSDFSIFLEHFDTPTEN